MDELLELFTYHFFLNAIGAALLASITCGVIGSYIVTRRIVFISGGITHASFGGVGIAYFLGLNPILGAAIFGVLSALGIQVLRDKGKVREDSAIAIWWSLGMAIGIIFVSLTPGYTPNLMSFLFGNILTVTQTDLALFLLLAVVIVAFFSIFYNRILYIAFDEDFAKANHTPVITFNGILISLVALTIVLNIKVVGIILVLSLLTIPQTTANLYTKNFKHLILISIAIGFVGTLSGLMSSYYMNIPSGAAIIFNLIAIYIFAWVTYRIKKYVSNRSL